MLKLSIITINYNDIQGLQKTVESVVKQSSKDFEYIVIDGGSADGSAEYLFSQNENLSYWVSEPDKGIYNAMNKGILQASGDYLLFLNSGDVLIDDKEIISKIVLNLNCPGVYYAPIYLMKSNLVENKIEYPANLDERFLFTNTICQQAVIYHKSLFCESIFDEKLKYISDWKMHFSLFKRKTKFIHLNIPFAIYDLDGLTSKGETKYTSHKERLKTQFLDFFLEFLKYYGTNRKVLFRLLKLFIKGT
ncbi:glycosyltransferase family 2 protein [Flavobacterium limi]|uniref:Glycosyl transferase n=1 Tax=Flavobacterium limi TaxID=2045105 RepID=A0ABQ1U1E1_9FLAO|nr:glycosyltransferase family 2 protein [Flavobacterium limi]GGF08380.1 glycosyl transferase [Flavobacterium limi]